MNKKLYMLFLLLILFLLAIVFWKPIIETFRGGVATDEYRTVNLDCSTSTLAETIKSTGGHPTRILIPSLCEDASVEVVVTQNNIIFDGNNGQKGTGEDTRSTIRGTREAEKGSNSINQTIRVPENIKNIAFTNLKFDRFNLQIEKGGVILSDIALYNGGIIIGENKPLKFDMQGNDENLQIQNSGRIVLAQKALAQKTIQPKSGSNCNSPPPATTCTNYLPGTVSNGGTVQICNSVVANWLNVTSSGTLDIVAATLTLNNTGDARNSGLGISDATVSIWDSNAVPGEIEIRGNNRVGMYVEGESGVVNLCGQAKWRSCGNENHYLHYLLNEDATITCQRAGCTVPDPC